MTEITQKSKSPKITQEEIDHRRAELLYMGWYVALLDLKKTMARGLY
ncbi:MAG: hypothetical protein K6U80_01180 [Firmicutes bacterium]|nr:hypothetical protein [Bacillota bacterium]